MSKARDFQTQIVNDLIATITIASDADLSDAVQLFGATPVMLITPASLTSTEITFEVSSDGTTFYPLRNSDGTDFSLTVDTTAAAYILQPINFVGMQFIKIATGTNELADRTFIIRTYPV